MMIDYVPRRWLVESKSLKLYLNSFRNHGAFHEECTVAIGKRIVKLLAPKWLRIGGYFYPRGGMPIDVFWQHGRQPKDVWVPDQGVRALSGAGLAHRASVRKVFRLRAFTPTERLLANGATFARPGVAADTFASSESDIECPYRR